MPKTIMMLNRLATIILLVSTTREAVAAFTTGGITQRPTRLFVSEPIAPPDKTNDMIQEHDDSATIEFLGAPLDENTKERNRQLVRGIKSLIFETFFAGDLMNRAFARFYALETIARVPYFSYVSVLHLLETIGLWRRKEYLKIHFSESWNEMHHLLIMEELGGSQKWGDRFLAQHIAVFYYWIAVFLYLTYPNFAYNLNQAVEEEAYQTYDAFVKNNAEYLETQPAPQIALEYYRGDNLYMFDEMHTFDMRRPKIENLYDVFVAIRDDEMEHVKTMAHLQRDHDNDFPERLAAAQQEEKQQ